MRNRTTNKLNESGLYGLFKDAPERHKENIKGVDMVPTNANQCKVYYDGKSMFSNVKFRNGDIIEVCPTRPITKNSLYSREVRDMVFEVEPDDVFVIPMGYCQYYNIVDKTHPEPNCNYEWNPDNGTIIIRALCTIPEKCILILNIEK